MEVHPEPATSLRRSERLKRKRDTAGHNSSVVSKEKIPWPSKHVRVKVVSGSNVGSSVDTSTTTRNTRSRSGASRNHALPDVSVPIQKQKRNQKERKEGKKLTPPSKRPAEDNSEPTLHVEKRPTKRKRTGIPSRAHRFNGPSQAPPRVEEINIHSLPPELLSAVLEKLLDDEENSLCASALTCSTWRASARPFVYQKIVIRHTEDMAKLAHQIRYEPRIAFWIRTLRFEGKSVPRRRLPSAIERSTELDIDTWIYQFFSIIGVRLPHVRNLELFGFQHLSLRRADCQAFAEWILQLSHLGSVESLHLARCEMPPNALTAIIRSFPRLRDVALTCVGCRVFAQNGAEFAGLSEVSSDSVHRTEFQDRLRDGILKYPVFHPPPKLHSLSIDNDLGDYYMFNFQRVEGWLCPAQLTHSLRYLHGGGLMDWSTIAIFLKELGPSPVLRTLRMFIEATSINYELDGMDISNLVNLEQLILDCPAEYLAPESMECMCLILGQVNTTYLEEITLCVSAKDNLLCIIEMDKILCTDKFRDLKRFNISIEPDPKVKNWDAMAVAKSILPGVEARGILHLIAPQKAEMP